VAMGDGPVSVRGFGGAARDDEAEVPARPVYFPGPGYVETPVVRRSTLAQGAELAGPLVVEEMDATIVVPPDWSLSVLAGGILEVTRT